MSIWEQIVRLAKPWETLDGEHYLIIKGEENLKLAIIDLFASIGYTINEDVLVNMTWCDPFYNSGCLSVAWNDENGLNLMTFTIKE